MMALTMVLPMWAQGADRMRLQRMILPEPNPVALMERASP